MPLDQLDITPVHQADDLHVWEHVGGSGRLVACFSGIGREDEDVPPIEFANTATRGGEDHALFFSDPKRSWLNTPGLIEQIAERIADKARDIGADQIVTLGHSMGAYAAFILPAFTQVDVAVCFSPQASVHPEVAGDDVRWMGYRNQITTHRIRTVADHIAPETEYYVFFGRHSREAPQRDRFPLTENIKFFVMPQTVHNTPQRMKQAGVLNEVFHFAMQRRTRVVRRILKQQFGAHQVVDPTEAMLIRQGQSAPAEAGGQEQ
jgi:hypothetical protein